MPVAVAKEEAELARRTAKADPTVGIKTGQDGGKNVIGLTLSIPLNVRNDFSAETRAAERAGLEEKARFQSIYRKQRFSWQAAYSVWKSFDQQYQRWKKLAQGRVEKSAELLERQWNSRDLSTTDYLLALNQRAESLIAGIELENRRNLPFLMHLSNLVFYCKPKMLNTKLQEYENEQNIASNCSERAY